MMLEEKAGDWDESKHPRDDAGRFGFGGGGADDDDGGGAGKGEHPGKGYSKGAYVDSKGVIQTSSVYDAQRALHENRKVELDQPRKVSVLLQKLGETSARMIKQGKAAPVFNLCNVSVKGTNLFCADTKGIPRVEMPQMDKQQTKDFRKYLKDKGYKVVKEKQFASHLRATQNELNGAKVAAGAEKIQENGGKVKPIIISNDDYILDGHHAWGAKLGLDAMDNKLENDSKMHVHRVNISITKLLAEAEKFTGGKGRKDVGEKSFSIGEVFRDWDESEHPRDEDGKFASGGGGGDDDGGAGRETEGQGRRGSGEGGSEGARSPSEAQAVAEKVASGQPKLAGLPDKPLKIGGTYFVPGPFGKAKEAAEEYMREAGLPYNPAKTYLKVDPARATRVAAEFEKMKHDPDDPTVKASYAALAKEVVAQYRVIERTGLKVEFIVRDQDDPYATTPRLAAMDITENNHLWVFPTTSGFGSGPEADAAIQNNPMLKLTDVVIDGKQLVVNDVFRIVHDYFGHFKEGVGFRADGEDNAWQSHVVMFSEAARGAMTSETRGQNSWVNYGPHGEANRTASAADTHYAPQKIGLMPEWTWREGVAKAVFADGEVEVLSTLIERGLRLEECQRRIYVRSHLLTAHRAIALMEAEGFDLIPYDGEYIPGTELIDTREWDESLHPRDEGGKFGFGGGGEGEADDAPSAANDYGLSTQEKADLKVFGGGIKVDWKNKKEYDALRSSKSFGETLDKLPKQTGTFYRGMVISKKEAAQFTSVDKTVDIAKHSFASPQRDYAKAFTQLQVLRGPKGSVPIVLSIKNANAVAFGKAGYGASKNRLEVVLPIGGKIKVTSVKEAEFNGVKGFNVVAEYA